MRIYNHTTAKEEHRYDGPTNRKNQKDFWFIILLIQFFITLPLVILSLIKIYL